MSAPDVFQITAIAKICHEANKAYCELLGDFSQPSWEDAPDWQKESAKKGVAFHLDNYIAMESASHESWLAQKEAEGWVYGPVKDAVKKEHPCMVPFDELPEEHQIKDRLFAHIVTALRY